MFFIDINIINFINQAINQLIVRMFTFRCHVTIHSTRLKYKIIFIVEIVIVLLKQLVCKNSSILVNSWYLDGNVKNDSEQMVDELML